MRHGALVCLTSRSASASVTLNYTPGNVRKHEEPKNVFSEIKTKAHIVGLRHGLGRGVDRHAAPAGRALVVCTAHGIMPCDGS